jgi:predicted methyltransferase
MINRRQALIAALASAAAPAFAKTDDPALAALIDGPQRSAANKARDPWRHPLKSLEFWGLRPGQAVADIDPAGGYWTEIVAPYLAKTGGRYVAGMTDPAASDRAAKAHAAFAAKYADASMFGDIGYAPFGVDVGFTAPAASLDLVLYCRFIHDLMWTPGALQRALGGMYAALKPGGLLAIEEHRSDPRAMINDAHDGYVATTFVVGQAAQAGFVLDATSEINANPKDTKDHPFGVWTLPPTRRGAPSGQPPNPAFDHAKYDAIGESDRMTLRFKKPA